MTHLGSGRTRALAPFRPALFPPLAETPAGTVLVGIVLAASRMVA